MNFGIQLKKMQINSKILNKFKRQKIILKIQIIIKKIYNKLNRN